MNELFKPLPNDCIDFYDIGARRLISLAAGRVAQHEYLPLSLSFPIGRFRAAVLKNFPIGPKKQDEGFCDGISEVNEYKNTSAEILGATASQMTAQIRQSNASVSSSGADTLSCIQSSLFNFDHQMVGGHRVRLRMHFDNMSISAASLKSPLWHIDGEQDQLYAQEPEKVLSDELAPVVRLYTFRISSDDEKENLQPEYIDDHHMSMRGKPHPLLLKVH